MFYERLKKENVCEFIQSIRKMNPDVDHVIILKNFRRHNAIKTQEHVYESRIIRVFLPQYSPESNLIEFIWKKHQEDHLTDFYLISQSYIHSILNL